MAEARGYQSEKWCSKGTAVNDCANADYSTLASTDCVVTTTFISQ